MWKVFPALVLALFLGMVLGLMTGDGAVVWVDGVRHMVKIGFAPERSR